MKRLFETERIDFVEVSETLVPAYLLMVNDYDGVGRFIGKRSEPITEEQEIAWVQKKLGRRDPIWSMVEKKTGAFIGNVEIMHIGDGVGELGIAITAAMQEKGYGKEAIPAVIGYGAKQYDLHRIFLKVYPYNKRAIHVYEKCGFKEYDRNEKDIFMEIYPTGLDPKTVWSEHVQGVNTLYLSRKLRFDDLFFGQYQAVFDLDANAKLRILEIGCGPGALAEALRRRYPNAEITAIDRDRNFIAFAKEHVAGVTFIEGDATRLPFGDDAFDVTISYTVSEHVEPTAFFGEQRRVLKPGGVCLCLSARKGVRHVAPCLETTEEERAFWDSIPEEEGSFERLGVCRYPMTEAELPACMERNGFRCVSTSYAVADLTPDAPKYSEKIATAMIEADRKNDLEAIRSAHSDHDAAAIAAVNAKYDERLRLYRAGVKQWDTSVSVTMIVRGVK